ncbi:MAG: branched-chain-amino-acid transaminase [Myxococcota bacterium]
MKVWIDGQVVGASDARIPVTDHGLLYGDGLFEGLRVAGRGVFRLADHLDRLASGARAIGLALPGGKAKLATVVLETARAYDREQAYLRLIVTRGDGALGVDPVSCKEPRLICIAGRIELFPAEKRERGLDLVTASQRRPAADMLDPRIKSLNYMPSVLAKREARLRGADDALLLNATGHVAEASVANLFAVKDGTLVTPPVTDGALSGITRASVLEIAASEGIAAREQSLCRFDLFDADEVFLTGTGAGIVPVASLDGAPIGAGAERPITTHIRTAFGDFVKSHSTPF